MATITVNANVLDQIARIDQGLTQAQKMLETLVTASPGMALLTEALNAYKEKCFKEAGAQKTIYDTWIRTIFSDTDLSHPHRKILEYLLQQYDHETQSFKEVHFSKIVREARIGKNMAKEYFAFIEERNYVERRTDGYRVYYRYSAASTATMRDSASS